MNVNIKDAIKLSDGKQYVVCSKVNYGNEDYLYLVDIHDVENVRFCKELIEGDIHKVEELNDPALIEFLLPKFLEAAKDVLDEIISG